MSTRGMRPLLAVMYDFGAAGAAEILSSARGICEVAFVCDRGNAYIAEHIDAVREYATVCDITGRAPDEISELVAALRPAGVTTFSESQLALTARVAAACGLPFHNLDTVDALTDKYTQRRLMAEAGVDVTRCRTVRDAAGVCPAVSEVGLPAVIKPRRGAASRHTYRVTTVDEAVAALEAATGGVRPPLPEFVVEELLVGDPGQAGGFWADHVSVESLVVDSVVHPICVTGKFALAEPFRETGQFAPSTLRSELVQEVHELATRAVRALGVRLGATHTELKLTATGPRIIEVNGRLGGNVSYVVSRSLGFDLLRATIDVALGAVPQIPVLCHRQLVYQRYLAPPARRTTLLALGDLDGLRDLAGVRFVEERVKPGKELDWRRGTEECLAVVYGEAADHEDLKSTVTSIDSIFAPVYA